MPTPTERHAAYLAALDRLIDAEREANGAPWGAVAISGHGSDSAEVVQPSPVPERGFYRLGMDVLDGPDARLIAALRNDAASSLEGRRSILRRHRPVKLLATKPTLWQCRHCGCLWEDCPDCRDAAAGLPEVPDER